MPIRKSIRPNPDPQHCLEVPIPEEIRHKSACLNHVGVTIIKRLDQVHHPHPLLEHLETNISRPGIETGLPAFEQLILLLIGTSGRPEPLQSSLSYNVLVPTLNNIII
jgi:hypothetical protein